MLQLDGRQLIRPLPIGRLEGQCQGSEVKVRGVKDLRFVSASLPEGRSSNREEEKERSGASSPPPSAGFPLWGKKKKKKNHLLVGAAPFPFFRFEPHVDEKLILFFPCDFLPGFGSFLLLQPAGGAPDTARQTFPPRDAELCFLLILSTGLTQTLAAFP